jgi:hypothetical protein
MITRIRRHPSFVEVYHQEGDAGGLNQYQLQRFSANQCYVALVAVVYSLLRAVNETLSIKTSFNVDPRSSLKVAQKTSDEQLSSDLVVPVSVHQGESDTRTILALGHGSLDPSHLSFLTLLNDRWLLLHLS